MCRAAVDLCERGRGRRSLHVIDAGPQHLDQLGDAGEERLRRRVRTDRRLGRGRCAVRPESSADRGQLACLRFDLFGHLLIPNLAPLGGSAGRGPGRVDAVLDRVT